MKIEKKYSGIVIPAVTPLTADHKLDYEAVESIFNFFHDSGVHPFILGTTGEAASIPFSMKKEFIQLAAKLKKKGDVLYGGISSNVLSESIDLARNCFDGGVDVVVATLPCYYVLPEAAMLRYFESLAENIPGPLMIYNIPSTTHMSIPLTIIDQLSHHSNIVGVKDSERNEERLMQSLQLWKDQKDFSYLLGWAAKSADALLAGCDGLVPSTGNFEPKLYVELYKAAAQGDTEKAYALQKFSNDLGHLYQQGRTLGQSLWALKVLMKEFGLCESHVMPPIYPQDDEIQLIKGLKQILNEEIREQR